MFVSFFNIRRKCMVLWHIILEIKKVIHDAHILQEHPAYELKGCKEEGASERARQALRRVSVRRD